MATQYLSESLRKTNDPRFADTWSQFAAFAADPKNVMLIGQSEEERRKAQAQLLLYKNVPPDCAGLRMPSVLAWVNRPGAPPLRKPSAADCISPYFVVPTDWVPIFLAGNEEYRHCRVVGP